MTENNELLVKLKELAQKCPSRFLPPNGDDITSIINGLQGHPIGVDWTDPIPQSLVDLWDELSLEAKYAAFLVAANMAYSLVNSGE